MNFNKIETEKNVFETEKNACQNCFLLIQSLICMEDLFWLFSNRLANCIFNCVFHMWTHKLWHYCKSCITVCILAFVNAQWLPHFKLKSKIYLRLYFPCITSYEQCWGKLLLKVMHYNITIITLLSYFLWKVMCYVTFALLFKYEQGLIVCF